MCIYQTHHFKLDAKIRTKYYSLSKFGLLSRILRFLVLGFKEQSLIEIFLGIVMLFTLNKTKYHSLESILSGYNLQYKQEVQYSI